MTPSTLDIGFLSPQIVRKKIQQGPPTEGGRSVIDRAAARSLVWPAAPCVVSCGPGTVPGTARAAGEMSLQVEITTLTNKKVVIPEVTLHTTIEELKSKYQDCEGVPPDQQTLWFPMPGRVPGAQPASDFKWWDRTKDQLDTEVKDSLMAQKLLIGSNLPADEGSSVAAATVGSAVVLREGKAQPDLRGITLPCFIILQIRPSPGETDPSGMKQPALESDVIFDAIWETSKTPTLRKCFALFDIDGSGFLSKEELKAILTRGRDCNISHESAEQIIDDFDHHSDGNIDLDEFVKVMTAA